MTLVTDQQPGQGDKPPGDAGNLGHNNTDWRAALPEDLRGEKVFESIKGKDWAEVGPQLAKGYVHAQRLVGADKLILPGDKATPEELTHFYTKLGRPESPDKYSFKLPEGVTEDRLDKVRLDGWRKELFDAGIPAKAADRLISKFLADEHAHNTEQLKARDTELTNWENAVKQEFGDKFDEKINYARWAAKEYGSPELLKLLEESGMGSHPSVVKLLAKIGEQLSEGGPRGTGPGTSFGGKMTKENAQAALNAFNRDEAKQKALFDDRNPQHDAVVKERMELFQMAFPNEVKTE